MNYLYRPVGKARCKYGKNHYRGTKVWKFSVLYAVKNPQGWDQTSEKSGLIWDDEAQQK